MPIWSTASRVPRLLWDLVAQPSAATVVPALTLVRPVVDRNAIEVDGVTKRFGQRDALTDVSLTVTPGQVHALLGPNGAGKTTLLRVLSGIVSPDAGQVTLAGVDPRAARHLLGLVPAGDRSFYLFSGSRREDAGEPKHYASYLLQWEMMRRARELGSRLHDLWGIAPADAGPEHAWRGVGLFKKGFGGREVRWAGTWDVVFDPTLYRLRSAVAMARSAIPGRSR